jgi:hypothetical protein
MSSVTALRAYESMTVGGVLLKSEIADRTSYEPMLEIIENVSWATKTRMDEMRLTQNYVLHVELNSAVSGYTADKIADELKALADEIKFDHAGIWVATRGHVARIPPAAIEDCA